MHVNDPMYRGARKERVSVAHTERRPQVRMWMINHGDRVHGESKDNNK